MFFKIFCSMNRSTFSTPTYDFWTLQQQLLATKIVGHPFFFLICCHKKISLSAKSRLSIRRFGRLKRRWFKPMCSHCHGEHNSSSLLRFSNISKDFRQTNCGVALRIDLPTMLKWKSRNMTSFPQETGTNCFEMIFPQTTFVGFIIIILAPTPEIGQGLERILSCGARKPEQT